MNFDKKIYDKEEKKKMGKNNMNAILRVLLVMGLIFMLAAFQGCYDDDDDEGIIQVCNKDDNEFVVKLHRNSDGVVLREFEVGEWYDSDRCDEFKDVEEGRYYLTIHRDNQADPNDTSSDFHVDDGDYETFVINDDGHIERD